MKILLLLLYVAFVSQTNLMAQTTHRPSAPTASSSVRDDLQGSFAADGTYSNAFFGLTLKVPSDFTILNRGELEIYTKAGADKFKGNTSQNDKALDDALNRTIYLLMVTAKPQGSDGNAALELQVVKEPAGATANIILAESMKLLMATGKTRVLSHLPDIRFGGEKFVGVEMESELSQPLKHRLYVGMIKGYAMIIGLTFAKSSLEDMAVFDGMLNSFSFKKK